MSVLPWSFVARAKQRALMLWIAGCLVAAPVAAEEVGAPKAEPESYPVPSAANEAVVLWSRDRCEFVLIQKADGHGIIMQFSAERLKPGDVIESEFQFSVNSGKKFTIKATGETGMLRGYRFGLTRKQALKHFPKECKAPKE